MPRGMKKSYRKRRMARKGKSKGYKTNNNLRSLNPIAQRYICKMKYGEVISSALGGGTYGNATINLNSIFDPNRGGIGHQPYGHDTLATLYNRYRVISCSYRISAVASDNSNLQVAVIPTNELIAPTSISEVRENPRAKYVLQGNGAPLRMIQGKVFIPSLVGRTKSQYMADDRYQATFGTSPNEAAILTMFAGPANEVGALISVYFNVELEYTVECFDIKHLTQS